MEAEEKDFKEEHDSLLLINVLNAVGFSKEMREITKLFSWHQKLISRTFGNNSLSEMEIVGSQVEGISMPFFNSDWLTEPDVKVDIDFLFINRTISVIDASDSNSRINETNEISCEGESVFVEHDETFPGYVKLYDCKNNYLSSEYFRPQESIMNAVASDMKVKLLKSEINGPALTNLYDHWFFENKSLYIEFIYCLMYPYWPMIACNWIKRAELSGWPTKATVNKIISEGCTLVPVGHADCNYKKEQMRIGIRGEQTLFEELNEIQVFCYIILRCILKDDLQKICGDVISSYHMRNLMFWCIEKMSPNYEWTSPYFIKCIMMCLEQLEKLLESRFFPHYFIEERNLWNSKLTNDMRTNVITELKKYTSDVMNVLALRTFKTLKNSTGFNVYSMETANLQNVIYNCFKIKIEQYSLFLGDPRTLWHRYSTHSTLECFEAYRDFYRVLISDKKSFTVLHTRYVKNMLGLLYYSFYRTKGRRTKLDTATKLLTHQKYLPISTLQLRSATFLLMEKEYSRALLICDQILQKGIKLESPKKRSIQVVRVRSAIRAEIDKLFYDPLLLAKIKNLVMEMFYKKQKRSITILGMGKTEFLFFKLVKNLTNAIFYHILLPTFYMAAEKWAVPDVFLYELLSLPQIQQNVFPKLILPYSFVGVSIDPIFNSHLLKFLIFLETNDTERLKQAYSNMKLYAEENTSKLVAADQNITDEIIQNERITAYKTEDIWNKEEAVRTLNIMAYCSIKVKEQKEAVRYILESSKMFTHKRNVAYGYIRCILQILQALTSERD